MTSPMTARYDLLPDIVGKPHVARDEACSGSEWQVCHRLSAKENVGSVYVVTHSIRTLSASPYNLIGCIWAYLISISSSPICLCCVLLPARCSETLLQGHLRLPKSGSEVLYKRVP